MTEFDGLRAKLYQEALEEFPLARAQDLIAMETYLAPVPGESVLGVGEGNGFFVPAILDAIGTEGRFLVTDPSPDQLANLQKNNAHPALEVFCQGVEELDYTGVFDKVWSFGAFHHCYNQELGMKNMYSALKPGGKLVLCDVWRETSLSEHFDGPVAEYCCTGHDVKFLGDTYATTIARKAGFSSEIIDLPLQWRFATEKDVGRFIYKLHAMTGLQDDYDRVLEGCEEILGLEEREGSYFLHWPMKALVAEK